MRARSTPGKTSEIPMGSISLRGVSILTPDPLFRDLTFVVGEATVKAHVTVILKKLGVRSRTQAVIEARHLALPPAG